MCHHIPSPAETSHVASSKLAVVDSHKNEKFSVVIHNTVPSQGQSIRLAMVSATDLALSWDR